MKIIGINFSACRLMIRMSGRRRFTVKPCGGFVPHRACGNWDRGFVGMPPE
jgi:hypothetical protein